MNNGLSRLSIVLSVLIGAGCIATQADQSHAQDGKPRPATPAADVAQGQQAGVDPILDALERRDGKMAAQLLLHHIDHIEADLDLRVLEGMALSAALLPGT